MRLYHKLYAKIERKDRKRRKCRNQEQQRKTYLRRKKKKNGNTNTNMDPYHHFRKNFVPKNKNKNNQP